MRISYKRNANENGNAKYSEFRKDLREESIGKKVIINKNSYAAFLLIKVYNCQWSSIQICLW